jgi:hypothetical protein
LSLIASSKIIRAGHCFDGVKKFANGDNDVIRQSASLRDVVDAAEDFLDPILLGPPLKDVLYYY